MNTKAQLEYWLTGLAERLIKVLTDNPKGSIQEGRVMTVGPPAYRRLDCGGRALAYVRVRPRKRAVRIDISGLWRTPTKNRLTQPNASGSMTLMVRSEADIMDAARFLVRTVERTRAQGGTG